MSHQVELTFSAAVLPERREALEHVLELMADDPAANKVIPFADLPHTHFGRVVLLEPRAADDGAGTLLVTLDCDALVPDRLQALVEIGGEGLDQLFGACGEYPTEPASWSRLSFLRDHLRDSRVFYVHAVGRTLDQIRAEARLRDALEQYLDEQHDRLAVLTAVEVRAAVRTYVGADPALSWALDPAPPPALTWRLREAVHKIALPAILVVTLPIG